MTRLNKEAYERLVDEHVKWLKNQVDDNFEIEWVIAVLIHSIENEYGPDSVPTLKAEVKRLHLEMASLRGQLRRAGGEM